MAVSISGRHTHQSRKPMAFCVTLCFMIVALGLAGLVAADRLVEGHSGWSIGLSSMGTY